MRLKAKFQVTAVTASAGQDVVTLTAVSGTSRQNTFAKGAPSGSMNLTVDHPAAVGWLSRGKFVLVDIVESPS